MIDKFNKTLESLLSEETGSDGGVTADKQTTGPEGVREPLREETAGPPSEVDEVMLTGEEQIVRLLEERGTRMWQSDIAESVGFSESKTSRLLISMEKEGIITRNQVGREKVVGLPTERG